MRAYPIIQEALAGEAISVATVQPLSFDQEVSMKDLNPRVRCPVYMSCHEVEADFFLRVELQVWDQDLSQQFGELKAKSASPQRVNLSG